MHVMVVRGGDIHPSSAGKGAEKAYEKEETRDEEGVKEQDQRDPSGEEEGDGG